MRQVVCALLLGGAALYGQAALAEDFNNPHTLDKVSITGNRSVPTVKLTAVLSERPGARVVQSDIIADRDAIMKVLEGANVGGSVAVQIATKPNKHIVVEFKVTDQGVQAPVVTKVAPKLHEEIFVGNNAIPTEKLRAAAGLNPGDTLSDQKVQAAEQAVIAAYKAARLPISVAVSGTTQVVQGSEVDVTWKIVETKGKKKTPSREEQERQDQVQ